MHSRIAQNTAMSDAAHLLIPFASCGDPGCVEARRGLRLPALERLLARLKPEGADEGDDHTLSMPHERVLARQLGLPVRDGCTPWAAWQVLQSGRDAGSDAWGWITPCHWQVGRDHIAMTHPQHLDLTGEESQALLAAMRPYFEQDGIALEYDGPTLWFARGEVFRDFPSASLDRVVGHVIDRWLPRGDGARGLRRLQQEMQMLLYTHDVNEERGAGGLLPVNSFWVSGTGALPANHRADAHAAPQVTRYLRDAAMLQDWRAWASCWHQIDEQECGRLLVALDEGKHVALTLCGERNARTFGGTGGGLFGKLAATLKPHAAAAVLDSL
jgi:hypothetical protein